MTSRAEQKRRASFHGMAAALAALEAEERAAVTAAGGIPAAWHAIAREPLAPGKERVTIRLDSDVVRFFRSQGANWQPRVNRVLRAWMEARLAGALAGPEAMAFAPEPEREPEPAGRDAPLAVPAEGPPVRPEKTGFTAAEWAAMDGEVRERVAAEARVLPEDTPPEQRLRRAFRWLAGMDGGPQPGTPGAHPPGRAQMTLGTERLWLMAAGDAERLGGLLRSYRARAGVD